MKIIVADHLIELLKKTFPEFIPYWNQHTNSIFSNVGLITDMMPLSEYAENIIKSKDLIKIKKLFDFVELLIVNGDEEVQEAIMTGFLEYILNPNNIDFSEFAKYLGKNTLDFCRAYDEFTGVKSKGLW